MWTAQSCCLQGAHIDLLWKLSHPFQSKFIENIQLFIRLTALKWRPPIIDYNFAEVLFDAFPTKFNEAFAALALLAVLACCHAIHLNVLVADVIDAGSIGRAVIPAAIRHWLPMLGLIAAGYSSGQADRHCDNRQKQLHISIRFLNWLEVPFGPPFMWEVAFIIRLTNSSHRARMTFKLLFPVTITAE